MKTIIVEDEEEGMQNLILKLERHCPEVEIIAKCETGESAVRTIRDKHPQLVFLDIHLGTMTGFDVLSKVPQIPFEIIFTTAYDEYTLDAFDTNALAYILKPIRPAELKKAVEKAAERIQTSPQISRILLPDGNSYRVIHTKDILYCLADNVNTVTHLEGKRRFLAVKVLKSIYAMLPKDKFHRISRGAVVNLDYVESVHRSGGGYAVMKNDEELSVARARLDDFLRKLGKNF